MAATNITTKNYTNMPFFNEGQLASRLIWSSDSKVTSIGGCQQCASIWNNVNGKAWDLAKAGNGILIQNVGTDLDGNAYDLKIVANSVRGETDGTHGTVSIDVWGETGVELQNGKGIWVSVSSMRGAEAKMTFSYLKHGTSKAANLKATPTIYDIDSSNWGISQPSLLFNGFEGISLSDQTATCYVTYSSEMKINTANGTFQYGGDWGNNHSGKDITAAVTPFFDSNSFTMTYSGFGAGVDIGFDIFKGLEPTKDATISD